MQRSRNTIIIVILFAVLVVLVGTLFGLATCSNASTASSAGATAQASSSELEAKRASGEAAAPVAQAQPKVSYSSLVEDQWQAEVACPATSGSADGVDTPLQAIRATISSGGASGSVTYSTGDGNDTWSDWARDGEAAQSIGVAALKFVLTGDTGKDYDVWYRVRLAGGEWLDWASNGNPAGGKGANASVVAYQVDVLPKDQAAPGPTENSYVEVGPESSGDPELDAILDEIIATNTGTGEDALRNAYEYVAANYEYVTENEEVEGDWTNWSVPYAKEIYENGVGNCYRYSSLFCWLARRLGYEATVVVGSVPTRTRGIRPHAWVEITQDGNPLECDPDMHKFHPEMNLFMFTYPESQLEYYHDDLVTPY